MRHERVGILIATALTLSCGTLTREEAAEALEESQLASEAMALTTSSIELTTSFTIGAAVEAAADELRAFIESQLPCAAVTLDGASLTVTYGANPGSCVYRGQTYAGTHRVTLMANEMSEVVVLHEWTDMRNETVSVTGTAMVTWSLADATRHVSHELTWTRLRDGRMAVGSGDRTQRALDGGLAEGFAVDGERQWRGESGTWTLTIEGVEMRWVDPVPQAGTYRLDTPFDKSASITFERLDATTIHVVVTSGSKRYEFDVRTASAE